MTDLPAPFTPADCDVRDYPYLPVDVSRLFSSEFHAVSNDGEWRAGVTLWLKSFHQVPAGSLPADDIALARLAEFARDMRAWNKVRSGALRGWALCQDGRLYHHTVAEKALRAWIRKLNQRKSSAAGTAKRYERKFDPNEFDQQLAIADRMLRRLSQPNPGAAGFGE